MLSKQENLHNQDYNFDYLLSMPLWSLTKERIEQLNNQLKQKQAEFESLDSKTIRQLWEHDLESFLQQYDFGCDE